jgi:tripartite-type tricarboxylate transporter receptor subunit TctC
MNVTIRRFVCRYTPAVLALSMLPILLVVGHPAIAQDKPAGYPLRPIRLIVSVAPGAGGDAIARIAAQMLTDRLGQNAVVDNRPGGGGVIATELVARSAPDGYTLLSQGETVLLQGATKRVPFDVLKAFDPVVATSQQPYILLVGPNLPIKSMKDLVAFSATQTVTYSGSAGVGSTIHLGMEWWAQLSGAKLLFVPYKGSAPAIVGAMGGEIHMAGASAIAASGAIRSGKLRALATLGLTRIPALPDLPTVAEQGYPGFKITNRYTLLAPAGTPRPIIAAVHRVVSEGMHTPQMVQRLAADGSQPAERMTPDELKAALAREYGEIEQQVKRLNIKIQ